MPYRFDAAYPDYAYKTGSMFLGLDEKGLEIGIETERHLITVAGAGGGKGAALLIPNARRWPHNLVVIDPKGENAALSWREREAMGQKVCILDPLNAVKWQEDGFPDGPPRRLRATFNPLTAIKDDTPNKTARIGALGNGLVIVHDPRHMEWVEGARAILSGLAAFVIAEAPEQARTFTAVRSLLMQPAKVEPDEDGNPRGLLADARAMSTDTRFGGLIRDAGVRIVSALTTDKGIEKDFLQGARNATRWIDDEGIAETLGGSSFDMSELKHGALSLYLVLPVDGDILATYAPFLRLFVKAALGAMSDGGRGSGVGRRCLFLLDEFYTLGKLEDLAAAAGSMRSYGVSLWPFLQDLGQLHELYGPHLSETFFGNADAHIFFNNSDAFTLEYVSRNIGNLTPDEVGTPFETPDSSYLNGLARGAAEQHSPIPVDPKSKWGWVVDIGNVLGADAAAGRRAAFDNEMRAHQERVANLRARHEHEMRRVGNRRLEPRDVAGLTGKGNADKVAPSMIVFAPKRKVFNLIPAPYFSEQRATPTMKQKSPAPASPAPARQYSEGRAKWDASHPAWSSVEGIPDDMVNDYNGDENVEIYGMPLDILPRPQWPQFPQWEKEYRLGLTTAGFMDWYVNDWRNTPEGRAAWDAARHAEEMEKRPIGEPEAVILSKTGTRQAYYFDSKKRPVVVIYGPNEYLTCYHPDARAGFYEVATLSSGEEIDVQSLKLVQKNIKQIKDRLENFGLFSKIFQQKDIAADRIYLAAFIKYLIRMETENWRYMIVSGRQRLPNGKIHPILITPDEYFAGLAKK